MGEGSGVGVLSLAMKTLSWAGPNGEDGIELGRNSSDEGFGLGKASRETLLELDRTSSDVGILGWA